MGVVLNKLSYDRLCAAMELLQELISREKAEGSKYTYVSTNDLELVLITAGFSTREVEPVGFKDDSMPADAPKYVPEHGTVEDVSC